MSRGGRFSLRAQYPELPCHSRGDHRVSVTLVVLASLSLISDQGKSPILAVRASRPLSAYGPVRCPRVLSFCTCFAPRILPLPAQGIVRLTAPYITNEDATSSQTSATPGSFFPCYHDNHRIRTRPSQVTTAPRETRQLLCMRRALPCSRRLTCLSCRFISTRPSAGINRSALIPLCIRASATMWAWSTALASRVPHANGATNGRQHRRSLETLRRSKPPPLSRKERRTTAQCCCTHATRAWARPSRDRCAPTDIGKCTA
jgi:hypothetical protein